MKLSIRAIPKDGFCRCGRRWTQDETIVDEKEFKPEEVKRLKEERLLVVTEVNEGKKA